MHGFTGYLVLSEACRSPEDAWHDWLQRFVLLLRTIHPEEKLSWRVIPQCVQSRNFADDSPRWYVQARVNLRASGHSVEYDPSRPAIDIKPGDPFGV